MSAIREFNQATLPLQQLPIGQWLLIERFRLAGDYLKDRMTTVIQNHRHIKEDDEVGKREYFLCRDVDRQWIDAASSLRKSKPVEIDWRQDRVFVSGDVLRHRLETMEAVKNLLLESVDRGRARALIFDIERHHDTRAWSYHGPTLGSALYTCYDAYQALAMQTKMADVKKTIHQAFYHPRPRPQYPLAIWQPPVLPQRKL